MRARAVIAALAFLAAIQQPVTPLQAAAAAAVGASSPIHFDFGRRPLHLGAPLGKGPAQPAIAMAFHGGPVQVTTTAYLVWWLPKGAKLPSNYQKVVQNYFADIGGSALYNVLTTYSGSNGTIANSVTPGGAWTDTTAYPDVISDGEVRASIKRALKANPAWQTGVDAQFYLLTAQNAPVSNGSYCAYHSFFPLGSVDVVYAFIPDPYKIDGCQTPFNTSPNNDLSVDSTTTSINHEQAEMATDPLLNAWYADSKNEYINGSEVGDVCIYDFGIPLKADGANLVFANGDEFMVQSIFDNATGLCAPTL